MFSQRELAPAEDQGVVFSYIQASANSTIDQTKLFTEQVHDVYQGVPGNGQHLSADLSDGRLWRHGHETVERADEDGAAPSARIDGAPVAAFREFARSRKRRRRCREAEISRWIS